MNTRKTVLLVFCSMLLMLGMVSCTVGNENDTDPVSDIVIFSPDEHVTLIVNEISPGVDLIRKELTSVLGYSPKMKTPDKSDGKHEIHIGDVETDISEKAYSLLERTEGDSEDESGYLIYSDGLSIAIAYQDDKYGIGAAESIACKYLISDIVGDKRTLSLGSGIVSSAFVDPIEYQQAIDDANDAVAWETFVKEADKAGGDGEAIAEAVKFYYDALTTSDIVSWLANLYEPVICVCEGECQNTVYCGGGGFYYSNTARNTVGYLPDAESTNQALTFAIATGLFDDATDMRNKLPETIQRQIVHFTKSLQDPGSGYFYHPQWQKSDVDKHLSRRARDLTKSVSTLALFGYKPTYDTPLGDKGDGILPDGSSLSYPEQASALTMRLSASRVAAVSSVVPVAPTTASHLVDKVSFMGYLDELSQLNKEGEKSFYEIGNEIGSQAKEIQNRDKELSADYSLCDILINWFNDHQNKSTGLWDNGVNYDATNALLKIIPTYNTFGKVFPNADLAVESCITMLTSKDEVKTVCYVYNVWYALAELQNNITTHAKTAEDRLLAERTRARLLEMAPEAIRISAEKQLTFKKKDGSFSFEPDKAAEYSQGLKVTLANTNEGDVNATSLCANGTIERCLAALGLASYAPRQYGKAESATFVSILSELDPVIKDEIGDPREPITFDDSLTLPVGVEISSLKSSGGSIEIIEDSRGDGNVLEVKSTNDGYDRVLFNIQNSIASSESCQIFESDMCITSSEEGYTVQLIMGTAYMLCFKASGNTVNIWDCSSGNHTLYIENELGITPEIGEWFNIKVEYYNGDHNSVRIKVYYNGKLAAVSDNYYDANSVKITEGESVPTNVFNNTRIAVLSTEAASFLMDNVCLYRTNDLYKPVPTADLPINVDAGNKDRVVHDFEGIEGLDKLKDGIILNGGFSLTDASVSDAVTKALKLTTADTDLLSVYSVTRTAGARCMSNEMRFILTELAGGATLELNMRENNSRGKYLTRFIIEIENIDGKKLLSIRENPDGTLGNYTDCYKIEVEDSFILKAEFFEASNTTVFYVNGEIAAISQSVCSNAKLYKAARLDIVSSGNVNGLVIDDLFSERIKRSLDEAIEPEGESKPVDFESAIPENVTVTDGEIVTVDGKKLLNLASAGAGITLPINRRDTGCKTVIFSTELYRSESTSGAYRISLLTADGKAALAYDLVTTDLKVMVHEVTNAKGRYNYPLFSFEITDKAIFTFEYYTTQNIAKLLLGEVVMANSSLIYGTEFTQADLASVKVELLTSSSLYFNGITAESYTKVYEESKVVAENSENGKTLLTFEDSFTGNIPSGLTATLRSLGGKVTVEEAVRNGVASKVIGFNSTNGNNDALVFKKINTDKKDAAVFTLDLKIDSNVSGGRSVYQLYFRKGDTPAKDSAFCLEIRYTDGGAVEVLNVTPKGQSKQHITVASTGEWINLRLEYYIADTGISAVRIFANNNYVGDALSGTNPTSPEALDNVRIYTYGAVDAKMLIDNASFATDSLTEIVVSPDDDGNEGTGGGSGTGDESGSDSESGAGDGSGTGSEDGGESGGDTGNENLTPSVPETNDELFGGSDSTDDGWTKN